MLSLPAKTFDKAENSTNSQLPNQVAWREVPRSDLKDWSVILESTSCSYRQFPYWVNTYEAQNYKPRFFYCGGKESPIAFVAIIEVGVYPFRFGLIDRGPYFFSPDYVDISSCLLSLISLCEKLGYTFVRFTQGQERVFSTIRAFKNIEQIEPYPFCRDSRNSMLIEQKADESETIASFSETARKRIRRAVRFNYEISSTNSESDFEKAWQLFENLASKKGFELSPKPKSFWRQLLKQGSADNFARLYLCSYQDELIAAQLHVRDGAICEAMLAALDLDALGENPSPAALMFFKGMRFGYEFGCGHFNIGGPGDAKRNNYLFDFKRKFKPTLHVAPEPLCLVLSPQRYRFWIHVVLRGWRAWRYRFGKSMKKPTPSMRAFGGSEELNSL